MKKASIQQTFSVLNQVSIGLGFVAKWGIHQNGHFNDKARDFGQLLSGGNHQPTIICQIFLIGLILETTQTPIIID
jgi:hypothetical protein